MQHADGGGGGDVAIGRPGVEGPESGEHAEADHDEGEEDLLEVAGEVGFLEREQVEGADAGFDVDRDDGDPDEHAARDEVEHQLHGAVFLVGAAPDGDEQVHGQHGELVEEEEEEDVEGEEGAVDAGEQRHEEDEVLLGAVVDAPGDDHAGEGDDAGEEDHQRRNAVGAPVHGDAQALDPLPLALELIAAGVVVVGDEGVDGEAEHGHRGQQGDGLDGRGPGRGGEQDQAGRSRREGDEDGEQRVVQGGLPSSPRPRR